MPGPKKAPSGPPWWLAIVAVVTIGGAIAGGYSLAQTEDAAKEDVAKSQALASGPEPSEPVPPPEPAPAEADTDVVEDELAPEASDEAAELAAKTGFDLLVEPSGAKVSLNGHPVGTAPLRVRNLLPGTHSIDVEGPEGYFGQHQEIALEAGDSMVLRLALVPLEATGTPPEKTPPEAVVAPEPKPRKAKAKVASPGSGQPNSGKPKPPSASEEKDLASKKKVSLGSLMLGSKPPCAILINGKKTGLTTPQRAIQLPEGIHRVVLVSEEHDIRKSFKVRIKAGRTTRAIQDLTKSL